MSNSSVIDLTDTIVEIYKKHGAYDDLASSLTDISAPLLSSRSPDNTLTKLAIMAKGKVMIPDSPNLPTDFVSLAKLGFLASLGFIFFYRRETYAARRNLKQAVTVHPYGECIQTILDNVGISQQIVAKSREDLNALRQRHGFDSLDGYVLVDFDKYAPTLQN